MIVAELIAELHRLPPDMLIVLARDSEGNGHSPLRYLWSGAYRAVSTYSGEVGYASLEDIPPEDRKNGFGEADVIADGVAAVILCPLN